LALGTAVRGRCQNRPQYPFTTELPGTDVAKLLLSGWTPVALKMGIEVAIRHDDWRTQSQAGSRFLNTANVEVTGYTDLVQQARATAREHLCTEIAAVGTDGAVVSDLSLRVWELEPAENHRDHVAEAVMTGYRDRPVPPQGHRCPRHPHHAAVAHRPPSVTGENHHDR
jgi:hypothetical protein